MNQTNDETFPEEVREIMRVAIESRKAISDGRIKQDGIQSLAVILGMLHEQNQHPADEWEYQFI